MRILKISDVYFPRVNGVSTSVATFRHDLASCGVETVLVAPDYGPAGAAAKLGMPRSTLESKIRSFNINKRRFKAASNASAMCVDVV